MKILVTAESIARKSGGGRSGILGICNGLAQHGNTVTLLVTTLWELNSREPDYLTLNDNSSIKIIYCKPNIVIMGTTFSFEYVSLLKKFIKESDIVLIHSIYKFHSTIASFICLYYNTPYIIRPHGSFDSFLVNRRLKFFKNLYITIFERFSFKHSSAIQFSSEIDESLTKKYIKNIPRTLLIPEGIDTNFTLSLPDKSIFFEKYPELRKKFILLFLGRLHQKKGLDLLIHAFAILNSESFHLVLAGDGDSQYLADIKKLIIDLGLDGRVLITGYLNDSDKLSALSSSDLFILPSYGENFGLAVVEAMACGLPVVISDQVGIFRDVQTASAGLVTPCDSNKIATAILKIISLPDSGRSLGLNGMKLVSDKFTLARMSSLMDSAYKDILSKFNL